MSNEVNFTNVTMMTLTKLTPECYELAQKAIVESKGELVYDNLQEELKNDILRANKEIYNDLIEKGLTEEVITNVMNKDLNDEGGTIGGIIPINVPLTTKIHVHNDRSAEGLCNWIFGSIKGFRTISGCLDEKYEKENLHLPIDTSTGDFHTEGDYINFYTLSQPSIILPTDETLSDVGVVPYTTDGDDDSTKDYVTDIYIGNCYIIQKFHSGMSDIIMFKSRMDTEIVSVNF